MLRLKPGIEPTPNHIVELVQQIKQEKAQLLIYGCSESANSPAIRNETGIKVVRFTAAEEAPETDSYIKWIDYTVRSLVQSVS